MWDRADTMAQAARDFADAHELGYSDSDVPDAGLAFVAPPFTGAPLRHCVSGEWRGRAVRRFATGSFTVEMMTLPRHVPTVQILPAGTDRDALGVTGSLALTGNGDFDARWSVVTDDQAFAVALLGPRVLEALMHPAAAGRAVTFCGPFVYSWTPGDESWVDARVRLEFLAVLVGRIESGIWQSIAPKGEVTAGGGTWTPAAERPEVAQWEIAPLLEEEASAPALSDTGEFEVALLNAELHETIFFPDRTVPEDSYGAWSVAPLVR